MSISNDQNPLETDSEDFDQRADSLIFIENAVPQLIHLLQILDKTKADFNGGYKIENLEFNGFICKTNVPSNTAFRSFGSPEGLLIMEDIIFNISCTLDLSQETVQYELRHVKRNSAFEHAQVTQIRIIQRMRKI